MSYSEPIDVALTMVTVVDYEGKPMALRISMRDLTVRRPLEELLKANESASDQARPRHIYLKGEIIPLKPKVIWQVCQGLVKLSTMSENGEEVQLVCFPLTETAASPALAQALLPQITQRLQQTECLLAISGQRHVKDRFYQLLQLLKHEIGLPVAQGIRLSIRFTHQDFADACSTTRVTITRLLGKFQEQGKIVIDSKHHIILVDRE